MEKLNFLIVEDEALLALELEETLIEFGFNVIGKVISGEEAVKCSEEKRPDFIIMDIKLAGKLDGIEATRIIGTFLQVPVVFVTANSDPLTISKALMENPYGYVTKPFDSRILKVTIDLALVKFKYEKELKEKNLWLKNIIEAMAEAVFCVDKDEKITFYNSSATFITGIPGEEILGKQFSKLYNFREKIQKDSRTDIFTGLQQIKYLKVQKTEKEIPVEIFKNQIRDENDCNDKNYGYLYILRDVSDSTKFSNIEKLKNFEKLLDSINIINIHAELLKDDASGNLSELQRNHVNSIFSETRRFYHNLQKQKYHLLIEEETLPVTKLPIDPVQWIEKILKELELILKVKNLKVSILNPDKKITLCLNPELFFYLFYSLFETLSEIVPSSTEVDLKLEFEGKSRLLISVKVIEFPENLLEKNLNFHFFRSVLYFLKGKLMLSEKSIKNSGFVFSLPLGKI